jgi:hypothetical protein
MPSAALPKIAREVGSGTAAVTKILLPPQQIPSPPFKVFQRSDRLPSGHVAVVSRVLCSRQIPVTHANWVHHRISEDQPVIDISAANDWPMVRVWWPPTGEMGLSEYPAYGFIRSDRPASHDQLLTETPRASRLAADEWKDSWFVHVCGGILARGNHEGDPEP